MAPIPDGNQEGPHGDGNDISNFDTPEFNIAIDSDTTSSDEDVDDPTGQGYQLLPQDPDNTEDQAVHPCSENPPVIQEAARLPGNIDRVLTATLDTGTFHSTGASKDLPPTPNAEAEERRSIWNKPKSSNQNILMDKDQVKQIKLAMANIKLPTPDWAKTIPEEDWKKQLFSRLQQQSPQCEDSSVSSSSAKDFKVDEQTSRTLKDVSDKKQEASTYSKQNHNDESGKT